MGNQKEKVHQAEDQTEKIVDTLKQKACTKQAIYRSTLKVFQEMKDIARGLASELASRFQDIDESVVIEYQDTNDFEFRLKFSGDLLMFTMHSNVITFPDEHVLSKSPYVLEDDSRGYFGHIMVYNFMADSVLYNRLQDPGYLLARLLVNRENHFYVEGVRPLSFLYPDIGKNFVSDEILKLFIEQTMLTALDFDLQAPPYQAIQVVPLGIKLQNQMVSGGEKLGFQMSTDQNEG